jgi:hypothetical protein
MHAPLVARMQDAGHQEASMSLELRLRQIHQRRRREHIRRFVGVAFWSFGLLAAATFVLVLSLGVVQQ